MDRDCNKNIKKSLFTYFISSIIGGYMGSIFCYWMLGPYYILVLAPANLEWSIFYVMAIETSFTFLFLVVVYHNTNPKLSIINDMVIGSFSCMIALYFTCKCCGSMTSAVMSPTLAIVNFTFTAYVFETTVYLKFLPAYVIGGSLGAVLAALFTKFCI